MEKRTLLAVVLCMTIFFGWTWLSSKLWPPPKLPPVAPKPPPAVTVQPPPPAVVQKPV